MNSEKTANKGRKDCGTGEPTRSFVFELSAYRMRTRLSLRSTSAMPSLPPIWFFDMVSSAKTDRREVSQQRPFSAIEPISRFGWIRQMAVFADPTPAMSYLALVLSVNSCFSVAYCVDCGRVSCIRLLCEAIHPPVHNARSH